MFHEALGYTYRMLNPPELEPRTVIADDRPASRVGQR
jgi:hypothetical protein